MEETTFTELELCDLVQRTLENSLTPEMAPEVWKALRQFSLRLLDEAAKPGVERRAMMVREIENSRASLRAKLDDGL